MPLVAAEGVTIVGLKGILVVSSYLCFTLSF